jgi:hypothetical protein
MQPATLSRSLCGYPAEAITGSERRDPSFGTQQMAVDDTFAKPIDVDELLLSEQLEPLAPEHLPVLEKLQP